MLSFLLKRIFLVRDFLMAVEGDKFKVCLSIEVIVIPRAKNIHPFLSYPGEGESCCEKKGFPQSSNEDIIFNFRDNILTASGIAMLLKGNGFLFEMDGLELT